MVMGIPVVEFPISQKSTEGSAYEALWVLVPSFVDSPSGCQEKSHQHTSMLVTGLKDTVLFIITLKKRRFN